MFEDRRSIGKALLALAGLGSVGGAGLWAVSPRVTERDAGLKIVRGELVDATVEPGVKMDAVFPHVEYITLPKFLQRMKVEAHEGDNIAVRTKEKAQVFGDFEIHYSIDNTDPRFGEIYSRLKCDEITDLEPFIKNYAIPAIIDTYRSIPTASVNDDLTAIGKAIAKTLQGTLAENGYPFIKIDDVIASGVGLSPKANADLEQIVSEERKLDLLEVQGQVADKAVGITQKQVDVTNAAFKQLREAGVPEDQLLEVYYLTLLRDSGGLGQPMVPGPIPGTGMGGAVINGK